MRTEIELHNSYYTIYNDTAFIFLYCYVVTIQTMVSYNAYTKHIYSLPIDVFLTATNWGLGAFTLSLFGVFHWTILMCCRLMLNNTVQSASLAPPESTSFFVAVTLPGSAEITCLFVVLPGTVIMCNYILSARLASSIDFHMIYFSLPVVSILS